MQLATNEDEFDWEIGIENPNNLQQILATYHLNNGAIATFGFNKRGLHIERPATNDFRQLTIIGDSLTTADIWATAGLSMAASDFKSLSQFNQLSGMVVYDDLSSQAFAGGEWFDAQKL
jgi:thiamine biosynthesis lipoprotein